MPMRQGEQKILNDLIVILVRKQPIKYWYSALEEKLSSLIIAQHSTYLK